MECFNKKLKELKSKYTLLGTKDIHDFKKQIGMIRGKSFYSEISIMAEDMNRHEMESLMELNIDEVVISEEKILYQIIEEENAKIYSDFMDIRSGLFNKMENHKIALNIVNFKPVYSYNNFISEDYNKVNNHYLKRSNRKLTYPHTVKDNETFDRQIVILAEVLKTDISQNTAKILDNFSSFIDSRLFDTIHKIHSALKYSEGENCLHTGEEIKRQIEWIKKRANELVYKKKKTKKTNPSF